MLGSFSFSTMFLLVKVMSQMNTFTLVFYRSIVQIVICLIDLYKKKVNPFGPDSGSVRFYLVLRAGFGAAAVIAWFYGIQNLPLPDAVTLQFTTPPFAAIFAVCLVGEHWKALDMIGAVVCLMGVALIAHPTWLFGNVDAADAVLVTDETSSSTIMKAVAVLVTEAGAAMAGIAYVCVRKIGDRADAVVMVFYYGIISLPMTALGSKMLLGTWNVLGDYQQFSLMDYCLLLLVGVAGKFKDCHLFHSFFSLIPHLTCTQIQPMYTARLWRSVVYKLGIAIGDGCNSKFNIICLFLVHFYFCF